jgi:hypothetical protein
MCPKYVGSVTLSLFENLRVSVQTNKYTEFYRLIGVVVVVLATGPKGHRFKPSWGDGFLRVIKIHSMPSFGWEVKPEAPGYKILRHVKDPLTCQRYWTRKITVLDNGCHYVMLFLSQQFLHVLCTMCIKWPHNEVESVHLHILSLKPNAVQQ